MSAKEGAAAGMPFDAARLRWETYVLSHAPEAAMLHRPCVDCGRRTGNFCETMQQKGHSLWQGYSCFAAERLPNETWALNQRTPLCTTCEAAMGACHFCRGQLWATPPTPGPDVDGSSIFSEAGLQRGRGSEERQAGTQDDAQD